MQSNGLNISNWDAKIYRIFSKKWFLDLLKTKRNGLVRTAMWDDPFENFFLKCTARDGQGRQVALTPLHDSWFGQCWTYNVDSDAMWRIYSSDKSGIRASTTIRRLFSSFYDPKDNSATLKYFIGEVQYVDRLKIEDYLRTTTFADLAMGGQAEPFAKTLCIKRPEFSHEREVRLLFHDAENCHKGNGVVQFTLDPGTVFDDVALDPRLDRSGFDALRDEIKNAGFSRKVDQSDLYRFDPPVIDLG